MSKLPGPSRIPTFGTRINQPGPGNKKENFDYIITPLDVGKKVLTVGKVGILRFVGKVHFASGVWCGIELETDVGKNDGCIDSVRYFICSGTRGLMTPLSKVTLLDKNEKVIIQSRSSDNLVSQSYNIINKPTNSITNDFKRENLIELKSNYKDSNFEIRTEGPPPQKTLKRDNTFEKFDKENKCAKNSSFLIDNNAEDCGNININNNKLKRNSILTSSSEKYFHSPLEKNFLPSKYLSSSTPSTSGNNGNSLLLVETVSCTGSTEIKTCKEIFEKTLTSSSQELNEHLDSNYTIIENGQKVFSKEPLKREITFSRHSSSSIEEREIFLENQNARNFIFNSQEEENKRDSLDLDESLEILSASQMNVGFSTIEPIFGLNDMPEQKINQSSLPNSNFDRLFQNNISLISDTTINLELTLDTIDESKKFGFARLEETPSPEELPLDPIPIIEEEPKSDATKSKTNSFITSITSITSLDTGYQGDGEMSRPGSRGADNSPLTRRPLQRPPPRRTEAMTDSDFFTESDADNHDENVLRGDRRAQVIDGTLYGIDAQATADIYVNNRENMDSSGIFTDIESNTKAEELLIDEKIDVSPSDTSSKTLSENSQNNLHEIIAKNLTNSNNENKNENNQNENSKKRGSNSPVTSITSSTASPCHTQKEDSSKKYKTLKRDQVQSKVKMILETNTTKPEKKILKKPAGRWDAVMNKISKTDSRTNFQEVKSRVFNNTTSSSNSPNENKKPNIVRANTQKTPNNKMRRIRTRVLSSPHPSKNSNGESVHSSFSDISASLPKKIIASNKKRDVQVTQVLTATKLSPKLSQPATITDGKRRAPPPIAATDSKTPRKTLFSPKEKKQISNKENGRTTVKGGRTSPVIRSPSITKPSTKPVPKTAEALAVLVQHLVFNVQAFEVPNLRKQVKKYQLEAEEIRLVCHRLEEQVTKDKEKNLISIEEERLRWREDVTNLIESHRKQISQITRQQKESEQALQNKFEQTKAELKQQYEEKINTLKKEFAKLQKTHEESLDILREENEAIREDIDGKNEEIRSAKHESLKLKKDYEAKESLLKEQIHTLSKENQKFKQELVLFKEEISKLEEDRSRLVEENKRLLSYGEGKGVGVQEVESLRVVLELKQNEVAELRKSLAETTQKVDLLANCEERAAVLQARCEDLQLQLQRKNDYEMMLLTENKKLEQSVYEDSNLRRSLSLRNEELQWKLKQSKEVITKILEQTTDEVLNRSGSNSFNAERYSSNTSLNISFKTSSPLNRNNSSTDNSKKLKNIKTCIEDDSPPVSPKIKGVVEKSDSVSYVLDLDESPDVVASRLVRRSFRNSLNQKNTPTKLSCNKRHRMKSNPLSQSSSASSLISPNKVEYNRSRSVSIRNGNEDYHDDLSFSDNSGSPSPYHYSNVKLEESLECPKSDGRELDFLDDHVLDLTLPALPSQIGCKMGAQALPSPKHLAGEAMISESNSDDESTSSSSGQL